jgi:hypothetical protein
MALLVGFFVLLLFLGFPWFWLRGSGFAAFVLCMLLVLLAVADVPDKRTDHRTHRPRSLKSPVLNGRVFRRQGSRGRKPYIGRSMRLIHEPKAFS